MKRGAHGHQVCLPRQRTPENTPKAFIVGHLGNAMMVHEHRQVWLRSPAYLEASPYLPYQGACHHTIMSCAREWGKGELHCRQMLVQRRGVDAVLKHRGHHAT